MKLLSRRSLWLGACAAVFSAGCGGGQSGGSAVSAVPHTSQVGDASVTYFGQPKPQLASSSGTVTVIGQAGATYSSVTLEPPANLADTYIVCGRLYGGTNSLYILPYGASTAKMLYQSPTGAQDMGISAYGTVAFGNDSFQTSTIREDGTGLTALSFPGPTYVFDPQYARDGTNRITFGDIEGDLYVAPGTGGTPTRIQTNNANGTGEWNPAGTEIAYAVPTSEGSDVYETSPTGGTATDITPTALRDTGSMYPMQWSADGVTILATYAASGASVSELIKFSPTAPGYYQVLTPSGDNDSQGSISPDGSKFLFYRTNANSATAGIYTMDASGLNQTLIYADSSAAGEPVDGGLEWSPFLPKETVVSASASTFYHQAASGFLLSQNGAQFGSLVAFTATTPADAAIQAPTSTDVYAPLAFTITADSITSIGYINNYFNPGTTVTLTSTPSVVVTIDSITGQVDLVAPASVAKPSSTKNADGTLTYSGKFKAVYDGTGKNLAPNGASSLTVNPKTGKLVGFK